MSYEKKHKEEIVRATQLWECGDITRENLEYIFPELRESEDEESKDESIRKWLICGMNALKDQKNETFATIPIDDCLAWLEKQGNKKRTRYEILEELLAADDIYQMAMNDEMIQEAKEKAVNALSEMCIGKLLGVKKQGEEKSTNKVEPKFHESDYIKHNKANIICKVISVNNNGGSYYVENIETSGRIELFNAKKKFHLWTIADAKDGDVLAYVTDEEDLWIMIFWSLYEPYEGHVHYHALLVNDNFSDKGTCCICINDLKPATKEQRDALFAKMKEAGYEWDSEKKELKLLITNGGDFFEMKNCEQKPVNDKE